MKVLWVCNIVLPVLAEKLGLPVSNKEGWLSGLFAGLLRQEGQKGLSLAVAFPQETGEQCFGKMVDTPYGRVRCYGFYEEVLQAEKDQESPEEAMRRIMADFQPDVIHCFGTEYGHCLAAVKAAKDKNHVLVGIQGLCAVYAQGYMSDLPLKIQRSVTFRDWVKRDSLVQQQRKFYQRGQREKEVLALAGNITGRTAFDRHYAQQFHPEAAYYTINETLREEFYEDQWPAEGYEPHTIFMSQGDYPLKGLHYALWALPEIAEEFPDVRLAVAGDDLVDVKSLRDWIKTSAYGKYLRSLIRKNRLRERVHFTGRLNAVQMKEQYRKSGLYLCCSVLENSPNSLGEAMLLGMPCVTADVGGIPSLFIGDQDGKLFRGYRSPEITFYQGESGGSLEEIAHNLAQAVLAVFRNEEQREAYCKNARRHASKIHDREENVTRVMEVYREIAAK